MKNIYIYTIFNNLKQRDLLVIVFILAKISIDEVEMDQTNLLKNLVKFNNKSKIKTKEDKDKKRNTLIV